MKLLNYATHRQTARKTTSNMNFVPRQKHNLLSLGTILYPAMLLGLLKLNLGILVILTIERTLPGKTQEKEEKSFTSNEV